MSLIHDAELPPSFNSSKWRWRYNPDLILAPTTIANQCERFVLDKIPQAQHDIMVWRWMLFIILSSMRRFSLKKADWKSFVVDLDIHYWSTRYFQQLRCFRRVAQGFPVGRIFPEDVASTTSRVSPVIQRSLNGEYTYLFEDHSFGTETLECGDTLSDFIMEGRRKK